MPLHVVPVTPHLWADLAAFFGPSGAYSGCWCTWWRRTAAEFDAGCRDGARGNRAVLQRLTDGGRVPGLLAYDGERPVGWVSVAPRPEFGRLLRSRNIGPGPDEDRADPAVWSVVCFWVPRAQRRSGVGTALLDAAVDHAQARGATVVEGYPVDAEGQVPAAEIFTGTVLMYLRTGFTAVPARKPGGRRVVVRRSV
jgi:GNAT superfamily N-acetyltransferase